MLALLAHQSDLELLEDDRAGAVASPLVRSAVTLDALIEQELGSDQLGGGSTAG